MSVQMIKAIKSLRPNAEFSLDDDDYSTIKWDVLDGDAPTQSEVNQALEAVKANEAQEALDKLAAKESVKVKLTSLGLTSDDLAALGL